MTKPTCNKTVKFLYFAPLLFIALFLFQCNSVTPEKEKENITEEVQPAETLATLAYETKAVLGEGAFWNHKSQELYWIDIEGNALHIFNPITRINRTLPTPSMIGTVVPKNDHEAIVALQDGVYIMDTNTGDLTLLSDAESDIPVNRFNDGKCDPSGRLWVGSMALDQKEFAANLYMIDEEGKAELKIDSITISNGIVWSSDKKTMYYIDTPTLKVRAFDYDNKTGNISNERVAVDIDDSLGFPDGMAIDEEDMIWVCLWNGNAVLRFNPKTGEQISKIEVPAHNITSCAFGGENMDTLYITSASIDMSEEELEKYPLAGSLFKVVPGVKGIKSPFFGKQ